MNKIASLKPGDDGVLIEALINHVVSGKTNGAHRSTYLSITSFVNPFKNNFSLIFL